MSAKAKWNGMTIEDRANVIKACDGLMATQDRAWLLDDMAGKTFEELTGFQQFVVIEMLLWSEMSVAPQ